MLTRIERLAKLLGLRPGFAIKHWMQLNAEHAWWWPALVLCRGLLASREKITGALLVPPDDPGSLGDDAMVQAALSSLRKKGLTSFGVVQVSPERRPLSDYGSDVTRVPKWNNVWSFLRTLRRYQVFYILGGDVMDGYYSEPGTLAKILSAHLASLWGRRVAIMGFSFNRNPTSKVVECFRRMGPRVAICLRDAQSLDRFHAATGRRAVLSADVAFLLQPSGLTAALRPILEWISSRRAAGGVFLGLNLNPVALKPKGLRLKERFIDSMTHLMESLMKNSDFYLLLLPHDYREGVGDIELLTAFHEGLSRPARERTRMVNERLTSAEVKELCGTLHAAISGRMHLCIACLGRGVPVVGISYQDKFRWLMEDFCPDPPPVLEVEDCLKHSDLLEIMQKFLERHEKLKAQIDINLPHAVARAWKNFRFP